MRLTVEKVGEFYEVFDWDTMTSLFAHEKKQIVQNERMAIQSLGLDKWRAGLSCEELEGED